MISLKRVRAWSCSKNQYQLVIRIELPPLAKIGPELDTWYATDDCYFEWEKVNPLIRNILVFLSGVGVDGRAFNAEHRESVEHLFFLIGVRIPDEFDDIPF